MSRSRQTARESGRSDNTGFPGGAVECAPGELRIAVDRSAYAEAIGHMILDPDVEVCGVLVGRAGKDERGDFVHVTHIIRGEAAQEQGAQVTFTHETWNHIHAQMDSMHADREIVGWYHSHGGFGIFLSEMDQFVHKNFFSAPHHVAYVFDPLAGTEGFFYPRDAELVQASRYWLGGRLREPVSKRPEPPEPVVSKTSAATSADAAYMLKEAALTLQRAAQQRAEGGLPWMAWLAVASAVALAAYIVLGGQSLWEPRSLGSALSPQHLLILEQDGSRGRVIGIPIVDARPVEGPLLRDDSGTYYVGVSRRPRDGKGGPVIPWLESNGTDTARVPLATDRSVRARRDGSRLQSSGVSRGYASWITVALIGGAILALGAAIGVPWLLRRKGRQR